MNATKKTQKIGALAAVLLAGGAFLAAPAANAATLVAADQASASQTLVSQTGTVIAQDQTSMLQATPSAPRAVTVTTEPGALVTLTARNANKAKPQSKVANKDGQATFTKLTAGTTYTVTANGKSTTVTPVVKVGKASDLKVMTTDQVGTVDLTWAHKSTKARGGNTIGYTITATPANAPANTTSNKLEPITIEATTTSAELTGLDPNALYSFSVTPHNAIGEGQPSVARMSRSLADITGITGPATPNSVAQDQDTNNKNDDATNTNTTPTPAPAPAPAPAPKPGPAPAPKPSTKTIYVCPDGWDDVNGVCTQTQAYTYSTKTETSPYTYHDQFVETNKIWHDDPFNPHNGCAYTVHGDRCMGWEIQGYNTKVKNPAPSGWTDNGSAYERQVEVKDATPAGWSDNGSQWIRTTAKVEKVVPA